MRPITALAAALLCVSPGAGRAGDSTEVPWAKSFDEAVTRARADKRLVLAVFVAKGDSLCRKLDREVGSDAMVAAQVRRFVPVKIDAEVEDEPLVARYKIMRVPNLRFIDPDAPGDAVFAKIDGYMTPVPFADRLATVADLHADLPELEERLKANPDDVEALARMAVLRHLRGEEDAAAALLREAEKGDPANAKGHLTGAYNAVGDGYQDQHLYESAVECFQKAAATAKDSKDVAYAKISLVDCFIALRRPAEAVAVLEEFLRLPGVPRPDQDNARRLLARARRMVQLQERKKPDR